jgi:hypothetical protein
MSKIIPWNTPFASQFFPSVIAAFATDQMTHDGSLTVVVGRSHLEPYPKYLVQFGKVLQFNCLDESCAPPLALPERGASDIRSCSWQWLESPTINSYQGCNYDSEGPQELLHYLIFGGDNIVEVVGKMRPSIEEVGSAGEINVKLHY